MMKPEDIKLPDDVSQTTVDRTQIAILMTNLNFMMRDLSEIKNQFGNFHQTFATKEELDSKIKELRVWMSPAIKAVYGFIGAVGVGMIAALIKLLTLGR